jgi:hypothetical protein
VHGVEHLAVLDRALGREPGAPVLELTALLQRERLPPGRGAVAVDMRVAQHRHQVCQLGAAGQAARAA